MGATCGISAVPIRLARVSLPRSSRCQLLSQLLSDGANRHKAKEERHYEVHDYLERTFPGHADRVRECTEADPGGLRPVESAREFQNRIVRNPRRRLGRIYVDGM